MKKKVEVIDKPVHFKNEFAFQSILGEKHNVVKFGLAQKQKFPLCKIYLGTDSQRMKGGGIVFVTVLAARYGANGANFIYIKQLSGRMKPIDKLRSEMMITMDYAFRLEESGLRVDFIEFDYNSKKEEFSNQMISESVGWATGAGFPTIVKPDKLVAVKAANHLCGKYKPK